MHPPTTCTDAAHARNSLSLSPTDTHPPMHIHAWTMTMATRQFAHETRRQALVESVAKAVALSRKHGDLIERYTASARALSGWIEGMRAKWAVRRRQEEG